MIQWIFNRFGYVKKDCLKELSIELNHTKHILKKHISFVKEVHLYCGSYPNWKAQQEYREIISERPLYEYSQNPIPLDKYLGRIVDKTRDFFNDDEIRLGYFDNKEKYNFEYYYQNINTNCYHDSVELKNARGIPFYEEHVSLDESDEVGSLGHRMRIVQIDTGQPYESIAKGLGPNERFIRWDAGLI